jgi:hypothetical protein
MSRLYKVEDEPPYIVLIGVPNQEELDSVRKYLTDNEIAYKSFIDNDFDFRMAAVVTVPLEANKRNLLKQYPLWKHSPVAQL